MARSFWLKMVIILELNLPPGEFYSVKPDLNTFCFFPLRFSPSELLALSLPPVCDRCPVGRILYSLVLLLELPTLPSPSQGGL